MKSLIALIVLGIVACGKGKEAPKSTAAAPAAARPAGPAGPAEYTLVLKSTWTARTHPYEYPSGAHFSGLIGASHNGHYSIFAIGRRATPGLERLAEDGKHSPLDDEIQKAIDAGNALEKFETGSLKNFKDSLVTTVRVDPTHPLVSLVAMIQPSPDWFAGAASVNLSENGAWIRSKTVTLPAYDAGVDDGRTYKAPNHPSNPKKPVSRASDRHFVVSGKARPVATVILIKK